MKTRVVLIAVLLAVFSGLIEAMKGMKETKMEMELYMHVYIAGGSRTEVTVAGVNGTASNGLTFGSINVIDGLLTEGSTPNTTYVGRCQGLYATVALDGSNFLMPVSLIFYNKKYNGSTIEVFGANRHYQEVRQVAIIGGTGRFQFARGTLDIRTVLIDPSSHYTLKFHLKFFVPSEAPPPVMPPSAAPFAPSFGY